MGREGREARLFAGHAGHILQGSGRTGNRKEQGRAGSGDSRGAWGESDGGCLALLLVFRLVGQPVGAFVQPVPAGGTGGLNAVTVRSAGPACL